MPSNERKLPSTKSRFIEILKKFNDWLYKIGYFLRVRINKVRKGFHDTITDYRLVRICALLVIPGYLGLVIIGHIIASIIGPSGYTIWTHMISDLGGSPYTPAPYLYDAACVIAGALTVPVTFYLEKLLIPIPKKPEDYNKTTRLRFRLGSYAFLVSLIGNIGYIGVGVFSEDRDYWITGGIGTHGLFSALAFGGFTLGAFFLGWIILLYDTKIPKILGIYGIFGPLATIIAFGFFSNALWEWLLLISILIWIIPLALIIMHKEELQIKPTIEKSVFRKNLGLILIGYVVSSYLICYIVINMLPLDSTLLVNMVIIDPIILLIGIVLFIKGKR